MRIIFYIILSLCAVQPCSAAEALAAQSAPVQCQPKSFLAKDIVLYDNYQSVLKALAGMPESAELTECINEFRDLTLWAGKKNGRRPKNFVKRVKLLRNVIIESVEIPDAVKDDALEVLNGIAKKRVGLSRGAKWGIGLGSAVVAAELLGCLVMVCRRSQRRAFVRAEGIDLIEAIHTHNVDRVRQLIQQGADVNHIVDDDDWTYLYRAVVYRKLDIARLLIEHGATVSFSPKEWERLRWFHQGHEGMYDFLRAKEQEESAKIARWNSPEKQAWMFAVARAINGVASDRLPARRSGGAA